MKQKVVVLGGGISGLAAAWFLKQQQADVTVLEASSRLGGWIETEQRDGFLFEHGPRSCRAYGTGCQTLALVEQLGLQKELISASPASNRRYLYVEGALRPLPTGPLSFLASPLMRPVMWPLLREWRVPPSASPDESIHDFVERRLGSYAACNLFDPLVAGIFAGDTRQLSVKSCFPFLHQWEQERGSILKGLFGRRPGVPPMTPFVKSMRKKGLFSFRRGMQQLVDALAERLEEVIQINSEVTSLRSLADGMLVTLKGGTVLKADRVISALPAHRLAGVMDGPLVPLLRSIPFTSVAAVSLGYPRRVLPKEGFGYLIPSHEGERILGVVWDSSVFPQQNQRLNETRLTVMIGGEHMANFDSYRTQDFEAMALEGLLRHLGITQQPMTMMTKVSRFAIPQYVVGHSQRIAEIREQIAPNLTLLGNSFDGVSVNDCIANASLASKFISSI